MNNKPPTQLNLKWKGENYTSDLQHWQSKGNFLPPALHQEECVDYTHCASEIISSSTGLWLVTDLWRKSNIVHCMGMALIIPHEKVNKSNKATIWQPSINKRNMMSFYFLFILQRQSQRKRSVPWFQVAFTKYQDMSRWRKGIKKRILSNTVLEAPPFK